MLETDFKESLKRFHGYSDEAYIRLMEHLELVQRINQETNITGITDLEKALYLHVYDSLLGLEALLRADQGRFADIGSGAGYPGIPLAIFSGRTCTLIESSKKKAAILEGIVSRLDLTDRITVKPIRAEEEAKENPNDYTAVCARAVGALASLMELACPLLEQNGLLIVYKGPDYSKELQTIDTLTKILGLELESIEETTIPIPTMEVKRTIITLRKTGEPSIELPRAIGKAQNKPIA